MTVEELQGIIGDVALEGRLSSLTATPADAERLDKAYQAVFRQPLPRTCGNCLYDAFILLKIQDKNDMENKLKSTFALKAGVILRLEDEKTGKRLLYSNANITDDVAKEYLAKHPNEMHYFSRVPEWYQAEMEAAHLAEVEAAEQAMMQEAEPVAEVAETEAQAEPTAEAKATTTRKRRK